MQKGDPCCLVIFGATGDLAHRKLYPALYNLFIDDMLPDKFAVLAVGRKPFGREEFHQILSRSIETFSREAPVYGGEWEKFIDSCYYYRLDLNDTPGYRDLSSFLTGVCAQKQIAPNYAFYLALPPDLFGLVADKLNTAGLATEKGGCWRRVVIEKPFGKNLETADALNRQLSQVFTEEQIFRIDHYLGKEMIQSMMVIRFANIFFEPLWNHQYIDCVQISSSEQAGVGERASYYDQTGALRDMVQNHMLQLLSLTAMEPPAYLGSRAIKEEKVKVFRSLRRWDEDSLRRLVVRGQYGPGIINGERVAGYRQEKGISSRSDTETFLAMKVFIDNFRWAGVPFYLRTGKRLPVKATEITLRFKPIPDILYLKEYGQLQPNLLVFKINPEEGVSLQFNGKRPGTEDSVVPVKMDFCQNCRAGFNTPEAYERLLLDVFRGDRTLFTSWDEVRESWRFIDPIALNWARNPSPSFPNYASGEWGPGQADDLLLRDGRRWMNTKEVLTLAGI